MERPIYIYIPKCGIRGNFWPKNQRQGEFTVRGKNSFPLNVFTHCFNGNTLLYGIMRMAVRNIRNYFNVDEFTDTYMLSRTAYGPLNLRTCISFYLKAKYTLMYSIVFYFAYTYQDIQISPYCSFQWQVRQTQVSSVPFHYHRRNFYPSWLFLYNQTPSLEL